jgi:hypothetical protein
MAVEHEHGERQATLALTRRVRQSGPAPAGSHERLNTQGPVVDADHALHVHSAAKHAVWGERANDASRPAVAAECVGESTTVGRTTFSLLNHVFHSSERDSIPQANGPCV